MSGDTPLHWAAQNNRKEVFQLLVENGANKEAKDNNGDTPLHIAVSTGNPEIIKFLLGIGATKSVNIKNNAGKTPVDLAAARGSMNIMKIFMQAANATGQASTAQKVAS